jgi:hypothetical protein
MLPLFRAPCRRFAGAAFYTGAGFHRLVHHVPAPPVQPFVLATVFIIYWNMPPPVSAAICTVMTLTVIV